MGAETLRAEWQVGLEEDLRVNVADHLAADQRLEGERSGRCYYSNLLVIELHACAQAMDHSSRQIARRQTNKLGRVRPSTIGREFSLSMSRGWPWLCAQSGLPRPKRREGLW